MQPEVVLVMWVLAILACKFALITFVLWLVSPPAREPETASQREARDRELERYGLAYALRPEAIDTRPDLSDAEWEQYRIEQIRACQPRDERNELEIESDRVNGITYEYGRSNSYQSSQSSQSYQSSQYAPPQNFNVPAAPHQSLPQSAPVNRPSRTPYEASQGGLWQER